MFSRNCGKELHEGSKFHDSCGVKTKLAGEDLTSKDF